MDEFISSKQFPTGQGIPWVQPPFFSSSNAEEMSNPPRRRTVARTGPPGRPGPSRNLTRKGGHPECRRSRAIDANIDAPGWAGPWVGRLQSVLRTLLTAFPRGGSLFCRPSLGPNTPDPACPRAFVAVPCRGRFAHQAWEGAVGSLWARGRFESSLPSASRSCVSLVSEHDPPRAAYRKGRPAPPHWYQRLGQQARQKHPFLGRREPSGESPCRQGDEDVDHTGHCRRAVADLLQQQMLSPAGTDSWTAPRQLLTGWGRPSAEGSPYDESKCA